MFCFPGVLVLKKAVCGSNNWTEDLAQYINQMNVCPLKPVGHFILFFFLMTTFDSES